MNAHWPWPCDQLTGMTDIPNAIRAEMRSLTLALEQASDGALTRIVGLLDTIGPTHGATQLLDRARPRLRLLRPPRRTSVPRLLFMPLDGGIHEPRAWQRHRSGLPRNALMALAGQVRAADPDVYIQIAEAVGGTDCNDAAAVGQRGRPLWAFGARAMTQAAPSDWEAATGLRVTDHTAMARLCIGVWRHAAAIWSALEAHSGEHRADRTRAALSGAVVEDQAVFSACLATLLKHHPSPGLVVSTASQLGPAARLTAERQLDELLAQPSPVLDPATPALAAMDARQFARTLADLEASGLTQRPDRRRLMAAQRHAAAEACHEAFNDGWRLFVLTQLETPVAEPGQTHASHVHALEDAARNLRRLSLVGRELGGSAKFDTEEKGLAQVLAKRAASASHTDFSRVELARLAEILCGPAAAMRVLDA
jgi:hypothetical protein